MRQVNAAGRQIVKDAEGLRLDAYQCPAGVWTIGYGHTRTADGVLDVKPGARITEHQADAILDVDLDRFERGVESLLPGLNDNQFSACVSLAFNIGIAAFAASGVVRNARVGRFELAAEGFDLWVRGGGKVLPGLVKRRARERALFEQPL